MFSHNYCNVTTPIPNGASPLDFCTYGIPGKVPYPFQAGTSHELLTNFFVETAVCPSWNVLSDPQRCQCDKLQYVPRVQNYKISM